MSTTQQIEKYLPELLKKTEIGQRPIRLIGVSLSSLVKQTDMESEVSSQLDFF